MTGQCEECETSACSFGFMTSGLKLILGGLCGLLSAQAVAAQEARGRNGRNVSQNVGGIGKPRLFLTMIALEEGE
jgi:hypothetical protein